MDVRIGVLHCPKELTLEVDGDAAELEASVNETLRAERAVLWLTDVDGRRVGVPLLGQVPLVSALRAGGDVGRPITVTEPESEAAHAFVAIAERLDALAPRRVRHPELRIS